MSQALWANVDINIVYKQNWDKKTLEFSIRYRLRYLVYLKAKTSKVNKLYFTWIVIQILYIHGDFKDYAIWNHMYDD